MKNYLKPITKQKQVTTILEGEVYQIQKKSSIEGNIGYIGDYVLITSGGEKMVCLRDGKLLERSCYDLIEITDVSSFEIIKSDNWDTLRHG